MSWSRLRRRSTTSPASSTPTYVSLLRTTLSGCAVGWAGRGAKSSGPRIPAKRKNENNNFPATVGESFNRFADSGLRIARKCVWRPGYRSARTRWGSYSAPPDPVAVIRGRTRGNGKERVRNTELEEREGRVGREGVWRDGKGSEVKGRESRNRGGWARLGYSSRVPRVPSCATDLAVITPARKGERSIVMSVCVCVCVCACLSSAIVSSQVRVRSSPNLFHRTSVHVTEWPWRGPVLARHWCRASTSRTACSPVQLSSAQFRSPAVNTTGFKWGEGGKLGSCPGASTTKAK